MALSFDWLGIADGNATDSRGALTLVGVGHNVIIARTLPHQEQRVIVITILDEDGTEFSPELPMGLDFQVLSPTDRILVANHQALRVDPKANPFLSSFTTPPEIPARGLQLVMGLGLEVSEYGPHTISATITIGDKELTRTRKLYVVRPDSSSELAS